MADLIGAMERLWFHQIILVPEPTSILLVTKNLSKHPLAHNCMDSPCRYQSSSLASSIQSSSGVSLDTPPDDDEISSSVLSTPSRSLLDKDDSEIDQDEEQGEEEGATNERPTRLNLTARRARSHSSSPSIQDHKRPKRHVIRHPERAARLQKSMSCRSFQELELEELKGFMDLGFKFKKEHLSPRLLRVIPGLQRLGLLPTEEKDNGEILVEELELEDQSAGVMRPYLSEAWLIRRPDSPLLNLRVPRVTAASEMKRHLRCWARTVASVIQQES